MTIAEAIAEINDKVPNTYEQADKIKWLDSLDRLVVNTIINTHEGYEEVELEGYTSDTDTSTELLIPAPYDVAYITWLSAKIDYYNREYNHYNNDITKFNEELAQYRNFYNQTHMPLTETIRYF